MPRVPAGHPQPVGARYTPGERQQIAGLAPVTGPAMRDPRRGADELGGERVELALDRRRGRVLRGLLGLEARVATAAEHQPPVWELLPVVEAVARVVRAPVEELRQRLGREHLPPDGRARRRSAPGRSASVSPSTAMTTASAVELLERAPRSTGWRSTISTPASAACTASRRTQRAGESAPSRGCTKPPANSRASGSGSGSSHSASKPSSRSASYSARRASRSTSSTASRRLPTRRSASPASSAIRSSACSVSCQRRAAASRAELRREPRRSSTRGRGERSRRCGRWRRRRSHRPRGAARGRPPRASVSAHEHPVTPPPTTTTSTGPAPLPVGTFGSGWASQYEVVGDEVATRRKRPRKPLRAL